MLIDIDGKLCLIKVLPISCPLKCRFMQILECQDKDLGKVGNIKQITEWIVDNVFKTPTQSRAVKCKRGILQYTVGEEFDAKQHDSCLGWGLEWGLIRMGNRMIVLLTFCIYS